MGDWVEVADDASAVRTDPRTGLRPEPAPLLQVEEVDVPERRVRLSGEPAEEVGRDPARHPLLRRWDHRAARGRDAPRLKDGALLVGEGRWLDLEDGVQVWFSRGGEYRPGDHWLIPARTLTGDVEWPRDAEGRPVLVPPAGVHYRYAPLAHVTREGATQDLRHVFTPLASPEP